MTQEFLEIMGTFSSGFASYLILESVKYGSSFSVGVLWKNNIKPILWTLLGAVVTAVLFVFLPDTMPFVEQTIGGEVDVTSYLGLMASGLVVGGLIKATFSNKKLQQEKAVKIN